MASISLRSSRSRRPGGLATRSSTRNNVAVRPGSSNSDKSPFITPQLANIGRKKRPRDPDGKDDLSLKAKRAKIAVEILPPPKPQPQTRSVVVKGRSNTRSDEAPLRSAPHAQQPQQSQQPQPPRAPQQLPHLPQKPTATAPPPELVQAPKKPTKHHQKVANGIRHEIHRLQPNIADLRDEKRKLRSQEGTRFKSELSAYFPEYDEVIGNEPKEERKYPTLCDEFELVADPNLDILNCETPIIIVDTTKNKPPHGPATRTTPQTHKYPLKDFPDSLFDDINAAKRVDFTYLHTKGAHARDDPLSDAYFATIHRKPERQERTLRNTDKGRAQHEKDQVIRLLEGLQGHDWLKLMGVSGITDSKKKDFEQARTYFIKGCEGILVKFRLWREEEKRRKLEKELALAEAEAEAEEEEEEDEEEGDEEEEEEKEGDEEEGEEGEEGEEEEEEEEEVEDRETGNESDGDPPDYSDVDASAARQLHEEATARSRAQAAKQAGRRRKQPTPPPVYEEEKEFTSFFAKPYQRAAALGKNRRSGRSVAAWGHPVPEPIERDFDLPEEYRDEETLKSRARKKRRDRRISRD